MKIIHRKDYLESKILQEKAFENPKIDFVWDHVASDISGNKKINSISVKNLRTGEERKIPVGGLFVAIGHEPNTSIFKGQVEPMIEGISF